MVLVVAALAVSVIIPPLIFLFFLVALALIFAVCHYMEKEENSMEKVINLFKTNSI